ncbi:ferric reductase NAD binding domain-containing protein [Acrodontium crateriforme]|uniref:Ferric reductase NAD binding domain-containing protein n=1 Tax=Acrodontium crateriforme TaxID=150365 RepID=A0AAQ3RC39_9PEZI|nr:ferric reductase NAD binding domain-containing protein [Acrodontium crateriforme]
MVQPIIQDQYTAARAYFASVIGLLFIESLIRLPAFLVFRFGQGRSTSWSNAAHWKVTVLTHKLLSLPSPIPSLLDYHLPHVLRFVAFVALNVVFGLNVNEYSTDFKLYGWLTIANAGLGLLLAPRTNLFAILLRIPTPILLQYHRWIGIATVAQATTHVGYNIQHYIQTDQVATSFVASRIRVGLMAWISLVLIFLTSLPIVRRRQFEIFYYTHALFFVFMVGALIHTTNGPEFLLPGFFLWVADRAIRFAYNFRRIEVKSVTHYDGGVTKFRVRGRMLTKMLRPGQVVWVQLRSVSYLNWHPFTIGSDPNGTDGTAILAIRGLGAYTRSVQFASEESKREDAPFERTANTGDRLKMRLDGPYGVGRLQWGAWPVTVLVAGGIGITPAISISSYLVGKASRSPQQAVSHIHLLWVVKNASHIAWFDEELRALSEIASREDSLITFDITIHITGSAEHALENEGSRESQLKSPGTSSTGAPWSPQAGRPDIAAWFANVAFMRLGLDAAVNVCGPRSLMDETRKAAITASTEKGIFHVEEEAFQL